MWQADKPFNELAYPPIKKLETKKVLKSVAEARAAVAALNEASKRIPNSSILLHSFSLLEAQASSEIENIVTTTDDLFQHLDTINESHDSALKETLRYREALFVGTAAISSRPLTAVTANKICSVIIGSEMRVRDLPGTFIGDPVTMKPVYTPPEGQQVIEKKLEEWEKIVHNEPSIDPIVAMAVAHYQFEAIHPFRDGNGRTGRIINILLLIQSGLLSSPILYLSRFIIENKSRYYELLLEVTKSEAWEDWILFMLQGVRETAHETLLVISGIEELMQKWVSILASTAVGANAVLLDLLFEKPYCRISDVVRKCNVSRQTAAKWLREIASLGLLKEKKTGRELLFINHQFMDVLKNS